MHLRPQNRATLVFLCLILLGLTLAGCVKQNPEKAAEYYHQSQLATRNNDSVEELTCLKKAVKYDQANVEYSIQLANVLSKKGKYEETEKILNRALRLNPANLALHMAVGENYISWVQTITDIVDQSALADKGLSQFQYVLSKEPDNFDALLYRANTLAHFPSMGDFYQRAENDFLHLLELEKLERDEKFALVYYYYGEFLKARGRVDEAEAIWQTGLQYYPEDEMLKERQK